MIDDTNAAPLDVAAIRAAYAEAGAREGLVWRYRVADKIPALCDALERERKISAAWKERSRALIAAAQASDAGDASASYDADRRIVAAEAALRALGVDPEAP